jgi:MFS family permease
MTDAIAGQKRTAHAVGGLSRGWGGAGLAVATVGWGAQQFTPLLLLYQARLGLSASMIQAVFATYVASLIPGLLVGGPISDRYGRRPVMLLTLALSVTATVLLILAGLRRAEGWLFAGRLLAGVASGAGFSSGAAWIRELSAAEVTATSNPAPRRVTVAMTIGFGIGPLVSGVLAQWAPAPSVLPYLPQLALAAVALPMALRTRETRTGGPEVGLGQALRIRGLRNRRFLWVVVPVAPWVFGTASVALAFLPRLVGERLGGEALIFSAVVILITAGAGVAVQPLARRVDNPEKPWLISLALAIVVVGMLLAASALSAVLVLAAGVVLGAGYGACQVCGLLEVQRLAPPESLAGVTAVYQAISYLGFALPFPLAAAALLAPPAVLLLILAGLAALALGVATLGARHSTPAANACPSGVGGPAGRGYASEGSR